MATVTLTNEFNRTHNVKTSAIAEILGEIRRNGEYVLEGEYILELDSPSGNPWDGKEVLLDERIVIRRSEDCDCWYAECSRSGRSGDVWESGSYDAERLVGLIQEMTHAGWEVV